MDALRRTGLLGRFDAPVEAAYRSWLGLRIRPLGATMSGTSALAWLAAPVTIAFADPPDVDLGVVFLISWGINLPLVLGSLLYIYFSPSQDLFVRIGTLCVTMTGAASFLVLGPALDVEASVYLEAAMFWSFASPLVLLPFRVCTISGLAFAAIGLYQAAATDPGSFGLSLNVQLWGMLLATLVLAPGMAFTAERWLRTAYVNEQLIEQQRALIRRYAPSSVVSRIEQGDTTVDTPQRRRVTIFFSDVVGFTTMADRVDPEALAQIMNDYLGALSELIERHGGTVNEFAGDGVMAIFGAPEEMGPADQVRAAVAAAQELQSRLPVWSKDWYQHGIVADAQARIGINTGVISVGTFGSAVRGTYTGIGLQTNIAARIQSEAPPGGILLSNTSWHLIKDQVPCEPRGQVEVKGVHFPVELYAPVQSGAAGLQTPTVPGR